jgi:hypothetical protein
MKTYNKVIFVAVLAAIMLTFGGVAEAATPRLSVQPAYSYNSNVQVNVYGADAYSSVMLYYNPQNSNNVQSIGTIGTTDGNGNFNVSLSPSAYGMTGGSASFIYVIVNGQRSESIAWPGNYYNNSNNYNNSNCYYNNYYNCNNTYSNYPYNTTYPYNNQYAMPVTVNRNAVTVAVGQMAQVILSGSTQGYYVTSDSYTVRTSGVGNKLNIYGQTPGTSQVTVCSTNNQNYMYQSYPYHNNQHVCAMIWVTVTGVPYWNPGYPQQYPGYPQYQYGQYPYMGY